MQHPLEARYRAVWDSTRKNARLTDEGVAGSRFYFDFPGSERVPIPKRFDTFAIVCGLPFSSEVQAAFEKHWRHCLAVLGNPLAYGVEPQNRHTEIFLFQRPEEIFPRDQVDRAIAESLSIARQMRSFNVKWCFPFMTPDGTIVAPGYDEPAGIVDELRLNLRNHVSTYPRKQSQWMHVSLGRILEPLSDARCTALLQEMDSRWREVIAEATIDEWLWIWEKQWYMVDRKLLHRVELRDSQ